MDVASEVQRLLNDMKAAAIAECNPQAERETTEIATLALSQSMPIIDEETPSSLISLHAQAIVVRSMRQHGEAMKALKALAA